MDGFLEIRILEMIVTMCGRVCGTIRVRFAVGTTEDKVKWR